MRVDSEKDLRTASALEDSIPAGAFRVHAVDCLITTKTSTRSMFTQGWMKESIRARVQKRRCYGCATWISTRTTAASPACLAIHQRHCCLCADDWAVTAFTSQTAPSGMDTGYQHFSPLSCLSLPDFSLYQTFVDGREETHQITSFIPEALKKMQRKAGIG